MEQTDFLIIAVLAGAALLGSVLWRYIMGKSQGEAILSTTLALLGFVLISTPLWASIVVRGPQWEVKLARQQTVETVAQAVAVVEAVQPLLPPEKAKALSPEVEKLRESVKRINEMTEANKRAATAAELIGSLSALTAKLVP